MAYHVTPQLEELLKRNAFDEIRNIAEQAKLLYQKSENAIPELYVENVDKILDVLKGLRTLSDSANACKKILNDIDKLDSALKTYTLNFPKAPTLARQRTTASLSNILNTFLNDLISIDASFKFRSIQHLQSMLQSESVYSKLYEKKDYIFRNSNVVLDALNNFSLELQKRYSKCQIYQLLYLIFECSPKIILYVTLHSILERNAVFEPATNQFSTIMESNAQTAAQLLNMLRDDCTFNILFLYTIDPQNNVALVDCSFFLQNLLALYILGFPDAKNCEQKDSNYVLLAYLLEDATTCFKKNQSQSLPIRDILEFLNSVITQNNQIHPLLLTPQEHFTQRLLDNQIVEDVVHMNDDFTDLHSQVESAAILCIHTIVHKFGFKVLSSFSPFKKLLLKHLKYIIPSSSFKDDKRDCHHCYFCENLKFSNKSFFHFVLTDINNFTYNIDSDTVCVEPTVQTPEVSYILSSLFNKWLSVPTLNKFFQQFQENLESSYSKAIKINKISISENETLNDNFLTWFNNLSIYDNLENFFKENFEIVQSNVCYIFANELFGSIYASSLKILQENLAPSICDQEKPINYTELLTSFSNLRQAIEASKKNGIIELLYVKAGFSESIVQRCISLCVSSAIIYFINFHIASPLSLSTIKPICIFNILVLALQKVTYQISPDYFQSDLESDSFNELLQYLNNAEVAYISTALYQLISKLVFKWLQSSFHFSFFQKEEYMFQIESNIERIEPSPAILATIHQFSNFLDDLYQNLHLHLISKDETKKVKVFGIFVKYGRECFVTMIANFYEPLKDKLFQSCVDFSYISLLSENINLYLSQDYIDFKQIKEKIENEVISIYEEPYLNNIKSTAKSSFESAILVYLNLFMDKENLKIDFFNDLNNSTVYDLQLCPHNLLKKLPTTDGFKLTSCIKFTRSKSSAEMKQRHLLAIPSGNSTRSRNKTFSSFFRGRVEGLTSFVTDVINKQKL